MQSKIDTLGVEKYRVSELFIPAPDLQAGFACFVPPVSQGDRSRSLVAGKGCAIPSTLLIVDDLAQDPATKYK